MNLQGEETYLLCRTDGRKEKEKAIRKRFSTRMELALQRLQKPGDALQDRVEVDALVAQFEIGEAELGCGDTGHAFFSGRNSNWFNSQMRSKAALSLR
jgi:hypothetical protein